MRIWRKMLERFPAKGQGLVEAALFFPILVFILAGLVEVSNLLVTQNRITTSSRISAGFGAANFNPDNWDITADAMGITALNTVTETLDLASNLWDIWAIRVETNSTGTGFDVFTYTHVYGDNQVVTDGQWAGLAGDVQADVLASLQAECEPVYDKDNKDNDIPGTEQWPCASDMAAVASAPFYNMDTILGLPVWQWLGLKSVEGLTVMRVGELPNFRGCPILPITIRKQQWSVYPTNWDQPNQDALLPLTKKYGNTYDNFFGAPYGNDPVGYPPDAQDNYLGLFPTDFDYFGKPGNPPAPEYLTTTPDDTSKVQATTFTLNDPGIPLPTVERRGYVYWAREIGGPGQFGWLQWRDLSGDTPDLSDSLTFPGNFLDPVYGYPNGNMDMAGPCSDGTAPADADCSGTLDPPCDTNPWICGNGDNWLDTGEWVAGIDGNKNANAIKAAMQDYSLEDIPVFLIVYDETNNETGENINYRVWDFAKINIHGWKYTASEKWVVFEFISWGVDCRQLGNPN